MSANWFCALDNNHVESQETRSGLAVCLEHPTVSALLKTAVASSGPCGSPPPPPSSNCCFYSDATCTAGQTCCSSSKKSYASESTCEKYGAKHNCVWETDTCVVKSTEATAVEAKARAWWSFW